MSIYTTCTLAGDVAFRTGNLDYVIVFGGSRLERNLKTLNMSLLPNAVKPSQPYSTRIQSVHAYINGTFCANILPVQGQVEGAVVTMYLASKEPDNRTIADWDEIKFDFFGKHPNKVRTKYIHDQVDVHAGEFSPTDSSKDIRYCIKWTGKDASFSINDVVVRNISINEPWRPLHAFMSTWGLDFSAPLYEIYGNVSKGLKELVQARVSNVSLNGTRSLTGSLPIRKNTTVTELILEEYDMSRNESFPLNEEANMDPVGNGEQQGNEEDADGPDASNSAGTFRFDTLSTSFGFLGILFAF